MKLLVSAKYYNKHFTELSDEQTNHLFELIAMEQINMELSANRGF